MKKVDEQQRGTAFVLTEIEKLEGSHPGVASAARGWFDQGGASRELPQIFLKLFGLTITEKMAENFRTKRWVLDKELGALKMVTIRAAIDAFGGDAGFDAALLAKLWELMDKMTIPQLISARTLFLRVRAQNLKEQEFLYKTGQWKPGQTAEGQEADPQAQQKNVLRRIKEIFGLATDEEPPAPGAPALESTSNEPASV